MISVSDEELRRQICRGLAADDPSSRKESALQAYQRFRDQLRRAAARRYKATAEEAVNEVFARLIGTPRQIDPDALGTYLHRAVASVQQEMRSEARGGRAVITTSPHAGEPSRGAPELWVAEHLEDLRRAGVSERDRELVALLAAGRTFEEAGRRLCPGVADPREWARRRAEHLEKSLRLFWGGR